MEDAEIVALYWKRDEDALTASADKYGPYCAVIARNILSDEGDAEGEESFTETPAFGDADGRFEETGTPLPAAAAR